MLKTDEQVVEMVGLILQRAQSSEETKDWASANASLKSGLELIGDRYFFDGVIEHTGTYLIIADEKEREGDLESSAIIRQRRLRDRLEMLKQKLEKQKVAEQRK